MIESSKLAQDALQIWQAGVDAVRSDHLLRNAVELQGDRLTVCGRKFSISQIGTIAVVGAGKAGAGMAAALEDILGLEILDAKVTGWLNVPADCLRPLHKIHLHAARPPGHNEPTSAGVEGSEKILEIVAGLGPSDLCLVLLSGGGSALLPAPIPEISLADKQAVTRFLMHAGATITQLNIVRKRLSRIKGGKLARACKAGATISLIISDVVGDPLDVIASGPTVDETSTDAEALAVLEHFDARPPEVPESVLNHLATAAQAPTSQAEFPATVCNHIIGNSASAVRAAGNEAARLGYVVQSLGAENQGVADEVGRKLARLCSEIRDRHQPVLPPACVISGGEPIVHLAKTSLPRRGGRNQELVLAALASFWDDGMEHIALLSGGTDGEDGPTDAAGAWADSIVLNSARKQGLDPGPFLEINDSYTFFKTVGGLLKTGPTHTNVMDLRVAVIASD